MTFEELREKVLKLWGIDVDNEKEMDYGKYYFIELLRGYAPSQFETIDSVKYIEHDGGGEGGAEDCYSVIQVEGVFYKVIYSYASYQGFYWEYAEVRECKPVERMVTFYDEI